MADKNPQRCPWCGNDPLYQHYHDHEWGVPVHDDDGTIIGVVHPSDLAAALQVEET